ncbi:TonB-dependent receptor plug domain-containing protein [Sphingorhabdus sp. Alg231-15]|uniref:TonB-dependent receptor plug domain-containing protein n=1 Tax=Sphingorhabdus sp. Alg231-15 TaxID=1922222 RepID=UPI00307B7FCB
MRYQKLKSTSAIATVALLLSPPAFAETAGASSGEDVIVVTAGRSEQAISQTGQSISVLDQDRIEQLQSVTVTDLLRIVPGVTINSNGGVGTVSAVNIRGGNSSQTVALIDGVKINDPASPGGGFDFGNLLTGNISRIEVLRGSQSVIWGSQAIGGVVNIITREPTEELEINARGEYGSRDTAQLVGNISGAVGPVAATFGAGYFTTDGFSAFNTERGGVERDGYRNFGANGKVKITFNDEISVDLRGYYSDGKTDIDGFTPTFQFGDTPETSETDEFVGYAGLNVALFDGRFRNRFAFAYTNVRRDNFNLDFQTFESRGENERVEYQGILDISEMFGATFGAEAERSSFSATSFGSVTPEQDATLTSFYGQLRITPLDGLTASAGLRYDDHNSFGGETTFAGDVVYSPNEGDTTFRASYGEGFIVPSLFQLFSDFGNAVLQPETSKSWDAGITQLLVDGKLELSATIFRRNSRNLIDFISCPIQAGICNDRPFGTYDNVGRARAQGVELGVTIRPVEELTIATNYSLIDAENRDTNRPLARRPRHSVNTSVDYDWSFGLQTGATIAHVSSNLDNAFTTVPTPGYVLVDLRAAMPITDNIEIYGRVENLFDEEYETIFQFGTAGRSAFAGVRLRY